MKLCRLSLHEQDAGYSQHIRCMQEQGREDGDSFMPLSTSRM